MELALYHGRTSTCSSKVRIVLAEKGLQWAGKLLDLQKGEQFDPEYRKFNPNAVVPTLLVDGTAVIESGLIAQLVDEIGPGPSLAGGSPVERAVVRLWLDRIDRELHPAVSTLTYALAMRRGWQKRSLAELNAMLAKMPNPKARAARRSIVLEGLHAEEARSAHRTVRRFVGDASDTLSEHPYVVGERLSLADLAPLPFIHRLERLGFAWTWETLPAVSAWYARMKEKESFKTGLLAWEEAADVARFAGFDEEIADFRKRL